MLEYVIFCLGLVSCFIVGIAIGIGLDFKLSKLYKRNASLAIARAAEEARRDVYEKLKEERAKMTEIKSDPGYSENVHEANESFEESLARLYPGNPEAQEEARKAREKRG